MIGEEFMIKDVPGNVSIIMSVKMDCLFSICSLSFNLTLLMLCFTCLETMIVAPSLLVKWDTLMLLK